MLPVSVERYLNKFGLRDWKIENSELNKITSAVIIPAICEYYYIRRLLDSLADIDKEFFSSTLFVFVVNNPVSSSLEVKENNLKSIFFLRSIIKKENPAGDELVSKIISSGMNLGLADASSSGRELPKKDAGAGLARKIGMDLALTVFDYDSENKKILISLDADCIVEKNYLSEIINSFNNKNIKAAVINYAHEISGEETDAIICYEIFLRYYELGLKFAGSPFAFHAIGSTIAFDCECYIKAGGMNKRKAGEDFYFLEKLAKVTSIERISGTTVHPSPRSSWRVPFGTGQRVNRFLSKAQNEYLLYNPDSFLILKRWLDVFLLNNYFETDILIDAAGKIDNRLKDFLLDQNFKTDWNKILLDSKTSNQINRQKINWFDGFMTLKLIHYLRGNGINMINMFDALDKFLPMLEGNYVSEVRKFSEERNNKPVPAKEIQMEYLNLLRKIL